MLIELMAAIAIMGLSLAALLVLASQTVQVAGSVAARERRMRTAHQVMSLHALLPARDLDLRLGVRTVGTFTVDIQRPEPTLYRIDVRDEDAHVSELVTVVYRPSRGGRDVR